MFQIWRDSLQRVQSYCWETVHRSFSPKFFVHPVGKTMRWIEKWLPSFLMVSTSSITMQSLGKIRKIRALAVDAKMCFFSVPLRSGRLCSTGCIVQTIIASRFMDQFWCSFNFFSEGIALSEALQFSFSLDGATIIVKLRLKIVKSPKIGRIVCTTSYR